MHQSPPTLVSDLSADQRAVVESMIGGPLESQDLISLVVMRPGHEPSPADKSRARARLERIFERVDRYGDEHNISPEEADAAIDAAVEDVRSRSK